MSIRAPQINDLLGVGALAKLKLGKGLAGKMIQLSMLALVVMGTVAYASGNVFLQLGTVLVVPLFVCFCIWQVTRFTNLNPLGALLEGAELVKYKEIEVAARGQSPVLPTVNVASPTMITVSPDDDPEENRNG